MIGAGAFRREQKKNQVNRLIVERIKINRTIKAREHSEQFVQLRQLGMRNGDAVANAGGTKLLALLQGLRDYALILSCKRGGARRELHNSLFLAVRLERWNDRIRREEIDERHGTGSEFRC